MPDASEPYRPINCEFHDLLEAAATRGRVAALELIGDDGTPRHCHARIIDLVARDGIEWMLLDSGERIRLDRIVAIDGEPLAGYPPG